MDFLKVDLAKAARGRCCVVRCHAHLNPASREHNGRFCRRCRDRRYKLRQPVAYAFNKLRWNAKRRGHEFSLTLNDFRRFCDDYGYLEHVGKTASSYSIDRIENEYGYHLWNIQVLTLRDNTRKQYAPDVSTRGAA